MKKKIGVVLVLSLLWILLPYSKAEAAYNSEYKNYVPDSKSNEEAIEILKRDGDLENAKSRFSLDKITTEQPAESINPLISARSGRPNFYYVDEYKTVYGIYQIRTNSLAPTAFSWYQNGIPASIVVWSGLDRIYSFYGAPIRDTGLGAYDAGYYWRRFSCMERGQTIYVWLSVWNLNNLVYR
ncbi:hypothetical protein GIX45_24050 [Erwinia sp. CPCC 100877]|nr:hypothetical protein [Erwinia sp. CPCC 100877]